MRTSQQALYFYDANPALNAYSPLLKPSVRFSLLSFVFRCRYAPSVLFAIYPVENCIFPVCDNKPLPLLRQVPLSKEGAVMVASGLGLLWAGHDAQAQNRHLLEPALTIL